MKGLRLALAILLSLSAPSYARPVHGGSASTSFGPGSPGFLSTCSSTFAIRNDILQSNSFGTSPWSLVGTGVTAPTLTTGQTDPNSGTTATKVDFPAVSGAGAGSYLSQSLTNNLTQWPTTTDIYIRGAVGGEVISYSSNSAGADFATTTVTLTTSWQRVPLSWVAKLGSRFLEIGTDLRDGTQSSKSAQSIYIWHAQAVQGVGGYLEWTYVSNTTSATTQNQTVNCPSGIAFRDFSPLVYNATPIIAQNTAPYNAGGVSGPYTSPWGTYGSSNLWAFVSSTTARMGLGAWGTNELYTSPAGNLLSWTDTGTNIATVPGQWDDNYMLHASILPGGCSLGLRCIVVSARDSTNADNHWNVGLWYSNDSLSITPTNWTAYASNPLPLTTIPGIDGPGLPTVVQIGSTLYMYVVQEGNASQYIVFYTSPVGDGLNWTFGGIALNPFIAGVDWSTSGTNPPLFQIDPWVFKNSHGFYEMVYTFGGSGSQWIGTAVSADGKTWYKYQTQPICKNGDSCYPGSAFVGDFVLMQDGVTFTVLWNPDDGVSFSEGHVSTMADH